MIRYGAAAQAELTAERLEMLEQYLTDVSRTVPGRFVRKPGSDGGKLFVGSLQPRGDAADVEVRSLLVFLNAVEAEFAELRLRVEDTLHLVRREPGTGTLVLDTTGGDLLRVVPPPMDELLDDAVLAEFETLLAEDPALAEEVDALYAAAFEDATGPASIVYDGPDPAAVPLSPLGSVRAFGPAERLTVQSESPVDADADWSIAQVTIDRRLGRGGAGVVGLTLSGELLLQGPEHGHVVTVDVVLRDAAGRVLRSEEGFFGRDVRKRMELELDLTSGRELADRAVVLEVWVDAYVSTTRSLARGAPGEADVELDPGAGLRIDVDFRRIVWPEPGWQAAGELHNEGSHFLATAILVLEAYDETDELVADDEVEVPMVAPGESRAYELLALADPPDAEANLVLRGRLVSRSRTLVCRVRLGAESP